MERTMQQELTDVINEVEREVSLASRHEYNWSCSPEENFRVLSHNAKWNFVLDLIQKGDSAGLDMFFALCPDITVDACLINPGKSTNGKCDQTMGGTFLMLAASRGDMPMVKYFVEKGADVKAVIETGYGFSQRGNTALSSEHSFITPEIATYLLEHGADPKNTKAIEVAFCHLSMQLLHPSKSGTFHRKMAGQRDRLGEVLRVINEFKGTHPQPSCG